MHKQVGEKIDVYINGGQNTVSIYKCFCKV